MSLPNRSHPEVKAFFHADTSTFTYVVHEGRAAVVIDPVLDYDATTAPRLPRRMRSLPMCTSIA